MSFNFNLYDELEVNKKATQEEIKKAYRKHSNFIFSLLALISLL